jgi:6-phosphogluconolactonase
MSDLELVISDDAIAEVGMRLGAAGAAGRTIVLTGGTSVGEAYELAAETKDWRASSVWWSDERCVPPDHELSNYGLARRTLLDRLEGPPQVHRMRGELDPPAAAAEYERELGNVQVDLLLLGLGSDGHVASLFAGSPQLQERERTVTSGPARLEPFVDRITFTLPTLLAAPETWFLVTGADKAEAVKHAFRDPVSAETPGSLLREGGGPLVVYLDRAAARLL